MEYVRYYPVIEMTSDGRTGWAVFPSADEAQVREHHKTYLEEIVPGSFRLHSRGTASDIEIRCPRCGKPLRCISKGSASLRYPVYLCDFCR